MLSILSSMKIVYRQCSNQYTRSLVKQSCKYCQLVKKDPHDFHVEESEDLNFNYQDLTVPKNLKMEKLVNLYLRDKIDIISKPGSFTAELFLGKMDTDFLFYPKLFFSRKDYLKLYTQSAMIKLYFRNLICKENANDLLMSYGFWNLWDMSMTEQCSIFQSIGLSMTDGILYEQLFNSNSGLDNTDLMKIFTKNYKDKFIRLILHNLSGSCLLFADKDKAIVQKYKAIMKSGAKIGFAFNETECKLGSLPFSEWITEAKLSDDKTHWILNGEKNKLLNDNYDYYIIFAKTTDYPEDEKAKYKRKYQDPYDGIVCLIVGKNDIKISEDKSNNAETDEYNYQKIQMEQLKVSRDDELFEAEEYGCASLSCRGIGILTTTAYQLGFLKSLQRQLYKFLIDKKSNFLNCKAAQGQLTDLTGIIYEIESMVYLIAAMYDSFDIKKFPDMTLETSILKSYTAEKSRKFLVKLQGLLGSKLMNVSKFHDHVNLYDTLFDSGMHHRLFTASMGSHFVGVYNVNDVIKFNLPFVYPSYTIWKKWQLGKNEFYDPLTKLDLSGHLHVKLVEEGKKLEYCLKKLEFAALSVLEKFKKDINTEQMVLLNISEIVMSVFTLTCTLSRASRAEIEGVYNSDYEIFLARGLTRKHLHKIKDLVEILQDIKSDFYDLDKHMYNQEVHKKNLKFNGYFPYPPIESTY